MCGKKSTTILERGENMSNANKDIRDKAKANNILLWQIAERLNITDATFSRKLRKELSADEKSKVFSIIDTLTAEQ